MALCMASGVVGGLASTAGMAEKGASKGSPPLKGPVSGVDGASAAGVAAVWRPGGEETGE